MTVLFAPATLSSSQMVEKGLSEEGRVWIRRLADRCQVVAGRLDGLTVEGLRGSLSDLLNAPPILSMPERFIVEGILGELLSAAAGVGIGGSLDWRPIGKEVGARILWEGVADAQYADGAASACSTARYAACRVETRVQQALCLIRQRHTSHRLNLRIIAEEIGVSHWHLTRLLKRHTGRGFESHLHSARILHAQMLLYSDACLSIKEIAELVGYSSATLLNRHFKQLCGVSPKAYRRRVYSEIVHRSSAPGSLRSNG